MKYIKLKCGRHYCKAELLIAINDWFIEEYGEKILEWYVCPICEGMIFPEEDCLIELP